jgi:homoserine/homoserine lactone efflux protein
MTFDLWIAYVLAMLVISISPGSGCINTLSTSLSYGFRQAIPAIAGLQVGLLIQLTIVGIGLGAIFATSPTAFLVLQWAGVLYLVWIGASKLIWPKTQLASKSVSVPKSALFNRAILINVTNPKAFVFLAAFFPQFIDQSADLLRQYIILAVTSLVIDTAVMLNYAWLAHALRTLMNSEHLMRRQEQFFGLLFVSAGCLLAIY